MIDKYIYKKISEFFPYKPTEEQQKAMAAIAEFTADTTPRSLLVVKGYAGTGKTSVLGAVVKALQAMQRPSVLLAPTGRAAKVFAEYAEREAFTIHKKIYRQKSFSNDIGDFSLGKNLQKDTLFIVDEASMISNESVGAHAFGSGHLLDDLIEYIYDGHGCRLILSGDSAQLPPVMLRESPALSVERLQAYGMEVREVSLKQVVRQDVDSGILFNATLIRNGLRDSETTRFPVLRLAGFPDIQKVTGGELIEEIASAYGRDGVDETIVICRSNKRATRYNNGIRQYILGREEEIERGERLMVVKNNYYRWSRTKDAEASFIANGEIVEVLRVRRSTELFGFHFTDVLVRFQEDAAEVELRVLTDALRSESPALSREEGDRLFYAVLEDYKEVKTKAARMKKMREDPYFNAVQTKYAYAITCHKAQGGQWRNVFLDIGYLTEEMLGEDFYRWLYTAVTRATGRLYLVNLPPAFEEGGGDGQEAASY